jgi:rhodanese-related sulfurtransferase
MKELRRGALASALLAWLVWLPLPAAGAGGEISNQQAQAQRATGQSLVFLDVRTPEEFASGHVPGAVNIPVKQLPDRLAELGKGDQLVVYCERGPRALAAVDTLSQAGYTDMSHMTGDMAGWRAAGLPIEK